MMFSISSRMAKVLVWQAQDTVEDVYVLLGTSDSSVRILDLLWYCKSDRLDVEDRQIVRCVEVGLD